MKLFLFFIVLTVVFRPDVQQCFGYWRVQERRSVRHQQEEPDFVQGLSIAQVPPCGHVQERLPLRPTIQLVQDSLPPAGTDGHGRFIGEQQRTSQR